MGWDSTMMNWLRSICTETIGELRSLVGMDASAARQPEAAGTKTDRRLDLLVTLLFLAVSLLIYGTLAYRLAQGRFLDYWNLGFDFDPARMVQTLAQADPDRYGFKHPLIILWRPFAWPFLALGLTAKESTALLVALFGSGTVAMTFRMFRAIEIARPEATALTLLFMVTGSQIFNSLIVDTYAPANLTIAFVWMLAAYRLADPTRFRRLRYLAGLMAFGTTITNVIQALIAEMVVTWRRASFGAAFVRTIAFGIVIGLLAIIPVLAIYPADLWQAAHDPIHALKETYWYLRSRGERTGIGKVLLTFFGFAAVSPNYSWLTLPNGNILRDFREYAFRSTGAVAMPLWLAFLATGTVAGLAHRRYRWLAFGAVGTMIFNIVLHMDFQFRGSLYLYTAHGNLCVFILAAGLAPWVAGFRRGRGIYIAAVLALAILVGIDNLVTAADFVTDFDVVNVPCAAPCGVP
jgi:hypothetical protein